MESAFTLPEVLLALALLTVAAVAVGGAVRSSLDLLTRARFVEQPPIGFSIAMDALLKTQSVDAAEEGDRINLPDGETVRWNADVEDTGIPDLFRVSIEIEVGDREGTREVLLFRPSWSNAIDRGPLMEDARRDIEDRLEEVER
ncbi:MAG: prepilin-type N-terminal cleavage/methylation domain-containing protein [Verrucomicrobiota bacterium]